MNTQNTYPAGSHFVLPGMGAGDQNPLLASMEMMRQAWQGMSSSGVFQQMHGAGVLTTGLTTEELDKRIADLRAVEGWLKLNLSMLTSSIQALEVQRATLATLKSYMGFGGGDAQGGGSSSAAISQQPAPNPSPLDIALGIKPSGQAKIRSATEHKTAVGEDGGKGKAVTGSEASSAPFSDAAQAWWGLLQQQFHTLTAATQASLQAAENVKTAAKKGDAEQVDISTENKNTANKTVSAAKIRAQNQVKAKPAKPSTTERSKKALHAAVIMHDDPQNQRSRPRKPRSA